MDTLPGMKARRPAPAPSHGPPARADRSCGRAPPARARATPKLLALVLVLVSVASVAVARADGNYREAVLRWRGQQDRELRADDGWLTVAGLFWLKEGKNRFGAAPGNEIAFPAGSAPPLAGVIELRNGRASVTVEPGVVVTAAGAPVTHMPLRAGREPDVLALGRLRFFLIARGGRLALRLRDLDNPRRKAFTGRTWFPVKESYQVTARFVPATAPRTVTVPNVLGQVVDMTSPGRAVFELSGRELSLDAFLEAPDARELFFIFRDQTAGKETYPAGRFLYSELPRDGKLVLDFNEAVSPPCAFTSFGTCPLPPRQNRLPVRIEAGETYHGGAAHP